MATTSLDNKPGRNRPVLLVEGDPQVLRLLHSTIEDDGFQVEAVQTAKDATEKVLRTPYSAVLIDTELPDGSGFSVAAELRRVDTRTPILFLAGTGARDAMLFFEPGRSTGSGLPYGGPTFLSERLLALVDGGEARPTVVVQCEPLQLNRVRREVMCGGVRMNLTQIEFRILEELMLNANHKVAPQILLQAVWGESKLPNSNVLAVHIRNLRKKLEESGFGDLLETVYGEGYVLRGSADFDRSFPAS